MSMDERRSGAADFGCWLSPISADLLASHCLRFGQMAVSEDAIYWNESRAAEGGRMAVVRHLPDGTEQTLLDAPYQARSEVHEYGGGEFSVCGDTVYFVNAADQHLYCRTPDGRVQRIAGQAAARYGEPVCDLRRQRIIAVREDHAMAPDEPVNSLVSIDLCSGREHMLATGYDFYSSATLSADGNELAWLCWRHPNMPWDGCELWRACLDDDGNIVSARQVAGGAEESVFQPAWSSIGELYWVADPEGWWNLYTERDRTIVPLWKIAAEFARPQWSLGMSTYGFDRTGQIICTFCDQGRWYLARLDPVGGQTETFDLPYQDFSSLKVGADFVALIAGAPDQAHAILRIDLDSLECRVLRRTLDSAVDSAYLSLPDRITFPGHEGELAHGFFYRPHHPAHGATNGGKPPLLVMVHGGPTGATTSTLKYSIQYWTSRGFAVLDLNYGGSSGFGRQYRLRLRERWGLVDVHDAVFAARHLVALGEVDPLKMAIRGASAGGFTTLCALTQFDDFKAGASYYGIADLESLVSETHKFESHDLERLVGPYPGERQRYIDRSPINALDKLDKPLILFQGEDDKVVPASQSERMYAAATERGVPTIYLSFPGESHGFRRAETIRKTIESELAFYRQVFELNHSQNPASGCP